MATSSGKKSCVKWRIAMITHRSVVRKQNFQICSLANYKFIINNNYDYFVVAITGCQKLNKLSVTLCNLPKGHVLGSE